MALKLALVAVLVVLVAATGLPLPGMSGMGWCADCASMAPSGLHLCLAFLSLAGALLALASRRYRVRNPRQAMLLYARVLYRPPRLP